LQAIIFFLDESTGFSEIFYEQLDTGFWLLAVENRGKTDNHYIIEPKRSNMKYYSLNIITTPQKSGCAEINNVQLAGEYVNFIAPSSTFEIFQKNNTILKCCHLIFTSSYLTDLTNKNEDSLTKLDWRKVINTSDSTYAKRIATKAEIFLQSRLFNILRYDRGTCHYKASILSIAFELTAFFLKLSLDEKADNVVKKEQNYPIMRAAKILQNQVGQRFPGLKALSELCNISSSKLKRDFKIVHGVPPLEYFRSQQIVYLRSLLNTKEKTIKELAIELGFKKSSSFSSWYEKITGERPCNQ
jgi:AraC-like DNA-binding protein